MMSEGIAHVQRSAALVTSYEVAVRMGHAEAHASLSWLLMVHARSDAGAQAIV